MPNAGRLMPMVIHAEVHQAMASGRFGVTIDYLNNADEIQIKVSQGAKPVKWRITRHKVDAGIAKLDTQPWCGFNPPTAPDIYSIEDLSQLIFDLKRSNPAARISVKLVAEVGVGTIAAGVTKANLTILLLLV
ncbi:Glutamate synthase [NADPH] large chain (EC [uncultured Gammaproteobacteria bacterium]|nr:Glutamate synthase [NADPH] large chain (EC [uncultured Gammaproteobacteria bacterium]